MKELSKLPSERIMAQTNSRVLLVIFFISVSIIPLVEMGHDLLHSFKNPFHYHGLHHKSYSIHTVGDHHHFGKMKFAYQMEENQHIDNLVWFAYQFSKSVEEFSSISSVVLLEHNTRTTKSTYIIYTTPPTPPPLETPFI